MKKLTYEFVKEQIESVKGYKLLSTEYINANTKLKIQCDKGHEYNNTYGHFYTGQRCPVCVGNQKHSYEYVKGEIESKGYKLLSKEYINSRTKLRLECPKGHECKLDYHDFKKGMGCITCAGNQKLTIEFVKEQIEKVEGYKLLSKNYKNARSKLKVQCNRGHIYYPTYDNFKNGKRCSICNNNSKSEKEVFDIVNFLYEGKVFRNNRTQIINLLTNRNLELDIWIPFLNKAIEFNGEYWHSSDDVKYRDAEKVKQCKEKNIDLLVIWYKDWKNNKNKVIKQIKLWMNL